jgi:DNA-directed RNA polymerase specialized sigma24 family protein
MMGDDAKLLRSDAICLTRRIDALAQMVEDLAAERRRVVFGLYQEHGWTVREIAAALDISAPRVWMIIDKHRKAMPPA